MKKIGFVYKYNPSEGKGILVFGTWKVKSVWSNSIKNLPILFSDTDLLSKIDQGCLVYFDFDDNKASNIERASLSNFKVDVVNSIVRCGERESEYSFYSDNTKISFECLETIIIPEEKKVTPEIKQESSEEDFILDLNEEDFDIYSDFFDEEDSESLTPTELVAKNIKDDTGVCLPESINDLFNCFGKYKHRRNKSITIDVFDLSLWVDQDVLNDKYYGMNVEELRFLYEIFVMRKHYDRKGNAINYKPANDVISSKWSLLLSKLSDNDLEILRYSAPKLQPAFPKEFCKKNVGLLTDEYGMPDVEICKLYCLHKISNAETVSEYKDIKHRLFVYCHCEAKHLEGEGTPMCQMGKSRINNLEKRLELQYKNVIKQNVISQLTQLCEDANVVNEVQNATPDEFNNVGLFIEKYNALRADFLGVDRYDGYAVYEKTFESYEKLPKLYKNALKTSLLNCVNESAILATQKEDLSPFLMGYKIKQLNDWILESTKQQIKELVNEKFSNLDDLEDLNYAYKYDYITGKQYFKRYKQLTSDFNKQQFLKELSDYKIKDSPLTIQWYVVSNLIKQLGYDNLDSFNYVQIEYHDVISNIRSLLKWLDNYGHLKDVVLKKAEERICSVLSDDDRWTLFEEKIAKSPGDVNIRKRLDMAYKKKSANKDFFKQECFQNAMLTDVDKVKDPEVLLFIADNLDSRHQYLMQQKATGLLKLYLWQKRPSGKFNWDLVKSHFHQMSSEAQIRTLRYIFGQMASGESVLVVDDLYSEFVETSTPACSAVCGVLFILKAKKDDINISITPAMLESAIGENQEQRLNFLKDSIELFYPCNGYLAITQNQRDIEYQSFNGILEKESKNDNLYYVITFHDIPVNLFGDTIEWLDSEYVDTAIQVLKRNIDVEIINGKYYISESQEFFVKQFVIAYNIDDKCGLVSDKERLIELGYLRRGSAYQPLYTNYLRKYEDSDYYVCRCGCEGGSDPNNSFPFFWCKKKICARRAHFLLPSSKWERFCFADFFFIVLGQISNVRESVWRVNAEISQFICDYFQIYKSSERNICSSPLNESDEKGTWDKDSSTYRDIYEDDEYDYYDEYDGNYDDYSSDYDEPTYDRYNGSYAQDEMGYSDDDIDTIFDGDPDAYWNID